MSEQPKSSMLVRLAPLLLLVVALGAFFALGLNKFFTLDMLRENRDVLKQWVHDNKTQAVALFILAYVVVAAASLPVGAVLSIAGGFLFGSVFGAAWIVIGATIGATMLFVIARSALGEPLRKRFGAQIKSMEEGFRRNAFSYLLILRLVPLFPFWLVNLAPAFLGVSVVTFVITTFIGIIPGAFVFASIGNGLNAIFDAGQQPDLSLQAIITRPDFYIPIGGLIILSLIPIIYKSLSRKPEQENEMSATLKADICIIGAGSGGLSVAAGAAQLGRKVILIERHLMGGDCLNYGCVPSKALIAAASHAHHIRRAPAFGVSASEPVVDFPAVMKHVQEVIAAIEPNDSVERFEKLGVQVIKAEARFVSPTEVEAGNQRIRASYFIVATGSTALKPPIPGLDATPFFTNETVFANNTRPDHLIVIGGGPIGMELAQAHRRLGSKVTILEARSIMPKDDAEAVAVVRQSLTDDGVEILEGAAVTAVSKTATGVKVTVSKDNATRDIEGSHILLAAGRAPNVSSLNLEAANVRYSKRGIEVDKRLRSSNPRVYAIGDVAGGLQFTHVAGYHAGLIIRHLLFKTPVSVNYDAVPWCTYTDPELAHVGLTEQQAKEAGLSYKVSRWPLHDNDRAQAERETHGFAKIIVVKGRPVGATIVGYKAGELILPWVMVISQKMKLSAMAGVVAAYPTMSEVSKRAASAYYTPTLFSRGTRTVVNLLSLLNPSR